MFCPQCHAEYREGFDECIDCSCPLVDELPSDSETDDLELTTVLVTDSLDTAETARQLLEEAGIEFFGKGGSFDPVAVVYGQIAAPIRVQVYDEDAEQATALLEHLNEEVS